MPETQLKSQGTQPPPQVHRHPRRTSPANSVTLRHHKAARDASLRASPGSSAANQSAVTPLARRNSSGESYATGQSDPVKWFDQSNENPTATFDGDHNAMDVDPPFFQRESESSNEVDDKAYPYHTLGTPPKLETRSSSSGDYRSVIDDLTIEIQKLKEELKRYKQDGPDTLKNDKLFEIKMHRLPKQKRRELEATLHKFAASLNDSPETSSVQRKKSRNLSRDHNFSGSGSISKHASSSSGSNLRPVDSAYASMSTGALSSGPGGSRQSISQRGKSSNHKVANYLRDIPEGLYPKSMTISDREKRKLVVRRLEQLFTGKIGGRHVRRSQTNAPAAGADNLAPVTSETQGTQRLTVHQPPSLLSIEPAREARILPSDSQPANGKKSNSRDNGYSSHSNSNGDQTETVGNGNSSGSGANTSPPDPPPPEQRPTRPKDLDPDRVQVPSENMEYIRHLGLVPPELLTDASQTPSDVHPDTDGWVYLNLLCNLAQLHIINVTPNFVLSAVSDYSTKFQISPDGRKIRWRGGDEGTKFSSDSSGENSQPSPDTDNVESTTKIERRKRQKTGRSTGDEMQSGSSSKNPSKSGPQVSSSSESFHYKPLFAQQHSPNGQSSMDEETLSSFGPVEDSNEGDSKLDLSRSGTSNRRKRRRDGAIIYYSGAPFCTDLSGDPGDSSSSHLISSAQEQAPLMQFARPLTLRSASGSILTYRPLSDMVHTIDSSSNMDVDGAEDDTLPGFINDSGSDSTGTEGDLPWTNEQQYLEVRPLEPCGLGGVLPEDHFMVVVDTRRPKQESTRSQSRGLCAEPVESTGGVIRRLAGMSTASPRLSQSLSSSRSASPSISIKYLSGRIKRLAPVALPPPAIFVPPFTSDSSMSDSDEMNSEYDSEDVRSSEYMSRQANPHQSDGYPDGVDLSSGDEDGEEPDDEPDSQGMYDKDRSDLINHKMTEMRRTSSSAVAAAGTTGARSKSASAERMIRNGSSIATAGEAGSRNSSDA